MMQKNRQIVISVLLFLAFLFAMPARNVKADGTETLGAPSIPIVTGSGIIAAGTGFKVNGLTDGTGVIDLSLPPGAVVKQVLLYWEGQMLTNVPGDSTIRLNGSIIVNGTLIGGPTFFFRNTYSSAFRADITNLNLIAPGYNQVTVDDVAFTKIANGAGLFVIYEDTSGPATIDLRDGVDLAFINFPAPRQSTVLQTFNFAAAGFDRVATVSMFVSSVTGTISGGGPVRPESLEIIVSGQPPTVFSNELNSWDGDEWDTKSNSVLVPAGATSLTVQLFSRDDLNTTNLPSSLTWIAGGLTLRAPAPALIIKKFTNGADADDPNGSDVPVITPGAPITWTYRVTNVGTLPFVETEITVTDDLVGPITQIIQKLGNMDEVLAPGETWVYQATGTALPLATNPTGVTIVQGCSAGQTTPTLPTYENIGTVVGTPMSGGTPVTDTDPSHYCNESPPAIVIKKATNGEDADTPTGPFIPTGGAVTWTYVVTNTGSVPLANVTVTDDKGVAVSCPQTTLAPGATMTCTATGIAVAGQYANIGSVIGTPPSGPPVTDDDPSHYFGYTPAIVIKKATNGEDADTPTGPLVPIGGAVTWTYVVTNTGNVTLTNVAVTDNKGVTVSCPQTTLTPGATMTCTATGIAVAGQYANIGSVIGTPPVGPPVTDDDPSHYFGYVPAAVGNLVFGDIDPNGTTPEQIAGGNGVQDSGEIGIDGVIVELYTSNGTLISTTVTSGGGFYLFDNLVPGDYYLVFINPFTGGIWTDPNIGTDDAIDSDPVDTPPVDPRGDAQQTAVFTLTSGQTDLTWDAGLIGLSTAASAAVGDRVWIDQNRNGIQDPGELGRPGVTVRLYTSDGVLVRTTTTNDQGIYAFTSLNPGAYFIEFVPPPNFTITGLNVGSNDEVDSDVDPTTNRTTVFTLADFVTDLRWDLGIFQATTGIDPDAEPQLRAIYLPIARQ